MSASKIPFFRIKLPPTTEDEPKIKQEYETEKNEKVVVKKEMLSDCSDDDDDDDDDYDDDNKTIDDYKIILNNDAEYDDDEEGNYEGSEDDEDDNDLEHYERLLNRGVRTDLYNFQPLERSLCTTSIKTTDINETEYCAEREQCHPKHLNPEQRAIFDYVEKNPNKIIIIQAGPGCGKSFCLKSISHYNKHVINTVIYKKDLLESFKYTSIRYTATKFFMHLFDLDYKSFQVVTQQLTTNMTCFEFMTMIISLLKRSKMPPVKNSLILIDEYTVLPKELLIIVLMLLRHYRVGVILCGDKNQLENIHTSVHSKCSSFDVLVPFADKVFTLHKNERCGDPQYNEIIQYFAQYSKCESYLDDFAYATVAAIFPKQLPTNQNYYNIHLGATHQELANRIHTYVINSGCYVDFYLIDDSGVRKATLCDADVPLPDPDEPSSKKRTKIAPGGKNSVQNILSDEQMVYAVQQQQQQQQQSSSSSPPSSSNVMSNACNISLDLWKMCRDGTLKKTEALMDYENFDPAVSGPKVGKFVPYLPLMLGGKYYVNKHSEYSIGTLMAIDSRNGSLIVRMDRYNVNLIVVKNTNSEAMFDQHMEYLKGDMRGALYSYPIYPANFMTLHKCQGCTITENLDISLLNTNYRGLYVALSRVKSIDQIKCVTIKNQLSHMVSAIVNYPELMDADTVTAEALQRRMIDTNYIFYTVNVNMKDFAILCMEFIVETPGSEKRKNTRDTLIELVYRSQCPQRVLKPPTTKDTGRMATVTAATALVSKLHRFRNVFMALACIDDFDRHVWLYEFIKYFPELRNTDRRSNCRHEQKLSKIAGFDKIQRVDETNIAYILRTATVKHLIDTERIRNSLRNYAIEVDRVTSKVEFDKVDDDEIIDGDYYSQDTLFAKELERAKKNTYIVSVRESSTFGRKIYLRWKHKKPITLKWLFLELNEMLLKSLAYTMHEPLKWQTIKMLRRNQQTAYSDLFPITIEKFTELDNKSNNGVSFKSLASSASSSIAVKTLKLKRKI